MQKIGPNGGESSAVVTPNGTSRKEKKKKKIQLPGALCTPLGQPYWRACERIRNIKIKVWVLFLNNVRVFPYIALSTFMCQRGFI